MKQNNMFKIYIVVSKCYMLSAERGRHIIRDDTIKTVKSSNFVCSAPQPVSQTDLSPSLF